MSQTDPRGVRLHALDAYAAFEAPREAAHLIVLGGALRDHVAEWGERLERLDIDLRAPFDATRAAALVLESVFDEVLTPDAWRVLAAAIELSAQPAGAA